MAFIAWSLTVSCNSPAHLFVIELKNAVELRHVFMFEGVSSVLVTSTESVSRDFALLPFGLALFGVPDVLDRIDWEALRVIRFVVSLDESFAVVESLGFAMR